jgi:hypothetical protein
MIVLKLGGARARAKAKDGRYEGRKPYGHRPGEQDIIERILQLDADKLSVAQMCETLNAEGLTPRGTKKHGTRRWYPPGTTSLAPAKTQEGTELTSRLVES